MVTTTEGIIMNEDRLILSSPLDPLVENAFAGGQKGGGKK
jgi:hypothetical protein